ncbi:hypothetical protein K435DRAFT_904749 [Dendrothele bispora CBS 962.96]|uniref:Uncharacterized protein n=1 Tax=Dendrothele bispora (strain CBS 962.96) TaxID=1314807 RepID=A0A4S8LUJ9_DENBC|nr:hypothetical protein K435DRAFT_904749 [Dendrothele bispora CBS 962.96]
MVLASNNTATATSSPATTATTIVSCDTGTIFAEVAKKYKKDSRKSTGALKEFWDLAFEEGRRAELCREGRRQEEEEERIRLAVKKAKREVEEEMRRMYEAIPKCAKEHTIHTVFRNGPIFVDPSTSHDRMHINCIKIRAAMTPVRNAHSKVFHNPFVGDLHVAGVSRMVLEQRREYRGVS